MFSNIKNKLSGSEKAGGLEIVSSADGSVSFNFCIAERKKNEIKPVFSKSEIKTLEELKEYIPADIPVAVAVSGKGVVVKKLTREAYRKFSGFAELIPDVKEAEIAGDKIITDDQVFLTIIRKSLILQYLELFDKNEIPVISVRSGPSFFGSKVKALSVPTVSGDFYEFKIQNKNIYGI